MGRGLALRPPQATPHCLAAPIRRKRVVFAAHQVVLGGGQHLHRAGSNSTHAAFTWRRVFVRCSSARTT